MPSNIRFTPSKLQLAQKCAWAFSPGVQWLDDHGSDAREFGTNFHRAIHMAILGDNSWNSETWADTVMCGAVSAAYTWLADNYTISACTSEVSYAYDVATSAARVLGRGLGRGEVGELLRHGEMSGTCDVVAGNVIIDWKTGRMMPDISTHAQLRAYGAMHSSAHSLDNVTIIAAYVSDVGIEAHSYDMSAFDIDVTRAQIRDIYESVSAGPTTRPGGHCADLYCPAILSCPAVQRRVMSPQQLPVPPTGMIELITDIKIMERYVDVAKKLVRDTVDKFGPVSMGDDCVYARSSRNRTSVTISEDSLSIMKKYSVDIQPEMYRSISLDRLSDATKGVPEAVYGELLTELSERGYVVVRTYFVYSERRKR